MGAEDGAAAICVIQQLHRMQTEFKTSVQTVPCIQAFIAPLFTVAQKGGDSPVSIS